MEKVVDKYHERLGKQKWGVEQVLMKIRHRIQELPQNSQERSNRLEERTQLLLEQRATSARVEGNDTYFSISSMRTKISFW